MRRMSLGSLSAVLLLSLVVLPVTAGAHGSASGAVVKAVFNKKLKKAILVNGAGMTLYVYTADTGGKPTCYNDATYHCSKAWPPLRTTGAPRAGKGVDSALLGVVKRTDGGSQVTYKGLPLYTDAGSDSFGLIKDRKPGDVYGRGFAGLWSVLSPKGVPF